ncbi:MAG: SRPBCC domain-containing protein [Kibdelosporangium sp.]
MLATLGTTGDGRFTLRFERRLGQPRRRVWQALTEPGQLRDWYLDILDFDRFQFSAEPGAELVFPAKGEDYVGHGVVTAAQPPQLLEHTWDDEILRWELTEDTLVFTTVFDDRDFAPRLAGGWHGTLEQLAAMLDGRQADDRNWGPEYQRAFS